MKVKFREIANFVAGQSPKSEYYSESDGVPFLQGNRTFGTFHPTIDTYTTKTTKIANKGDILMSVRAPVGDLNFAPVDLCIGRGLAAITAKDGDNAFLFYALKYNINNLLKQSNGTTYDSVTGDIVKEMDMIIPEDKSVCKKISKLLYTIDSKIENNKQTMAELESMAKTIYDYWFLQYEFPNEEGKPYKSSGGKMIYNEILKREIPVGWDVKSIKECIEHINTGLNPRDNFVLGNGNIKYITVKNLTKEGIFNYDGCDVIDEKAKEIVHNRSDVDVGDILFASIAPLGRCFLVQEYPKEWDINESVFCIRPNKQIISTEYLYLYLTSDMFIKQAENSSTGSIFSGIRINTLESMNLLVPNEKIKEKFTHNIKSIFLKKYKTAKENEELTKLRDELLPLLMNGQVSFKN